MEILTNISIHVHELDLEKIEVSTLGSDNDEFTIKIGSHITIFTGNQKETRKILEQLCYSFNDLVTIPIMKIDQDK